MKKKDTKTLIFSSGLILLLVAFDQLTKYWAVIALKGKPAVPIIKDVFELQYLENTSAAFGIDPISFLHQIFNFNIFNENPSLYLNIRMCFFYVITLGMVCLFWRILLKIPKLKRMVYFDLIIIFIISGAIGNLIDRISQKYVVDFFYFKLIDFPIFNIADIYITCAAIAMMIFGIFYYKDEDFEMIFPSLKEKEKENIKK